MTDQPNAGKDWLQISSGGQPRTNVKDGAALATAELKGDYSQKKKLDALLGRISFFGLVALQNTIAATNLKWIWVRFAGVDRGLIRMFGVPRHPHGRQRHYAPLSRLCGVPDAHVAKNTPFSQ
jgi:hypothetical protein